jgi:hypothetical protein
MLAAIADFHKRSIDRDTAEFLRAKSVHLHSESIQPAHNPPVEREILALAERDSSSFCYPADRSTDGCQLDAVLVDDEWTVFATPYLGSPGKGYGCCAADSARLFIYSRKGALLRWERGSP